MNSTASQSNQGKSEELGRADAMNNATDKETTDFRYCPDCLKAYAADVTTCPVHKVSLVKVSGNNSLVGEILGGKYTITKHLGRGGMGTVYEAVQSFIDRKVAVKVLNCEFAKHANGIKRFLVEARAASRLRCENAVVIHDVGMSDEGHLYYVMELVGGKELSRLLRADGPMPIRRALNIACGICRSLEEAHANGIVHRDLKPDNVMVVNEGGREIAKVLDFGIAKLMDENDGAGLTKTGFICGTPAYMSPEQAVGKEVTAATDIYALGMLLYAMLAGKPPFAGDTPMQILMRQINEKPRAVSTALPELKIPKALDALLELMLAKNAATRLHDAGLVRRVLEQLLAGELSEPECNAVSVSIADEAKAEPEGDSLAAAPEAKPAAKCPQSASGETLMYDTREGYARRSVPNRPADEELSDVRDPREPDAVGGEFDDDIVHWDRWGTWKRGAGAVGVALVLAILMAIGASYYKDLKDPKRSASISAKMGFVQNEIPERSPAGDVRLFEKPAIERTPEEQEATETSEPEPNAVEQRPKEESKMARRMEIKSSPERQPRREVAALETHVAIECGDEPTAATTPQPERRPAVQKKPTPKPRTRTKKLAQRKPKAQVEFRPEAKVLPEKESQHLARVAKQKQPAKRHTKVVERTPAQMTQLERLAEVEKKVAKANELKDYGILAMESGAFDMALKYFAKAKAISGPTNELLALIKRCKELKRQRQNRMRVRDELARMYND